MAEDEQFSLCWNNFNSNLSAGFHESLCRGDLVDVTLAAEGQLVKAHRLVLSVCSPYFRKMFTQMPPNQHAFVFLKDVSHSALKDLIQFMYCGEVNVKQEALPAFISTAEALQIKGLTDSDSPQVVQPLSEPTTPTPQLHQIQTSPRLRQQRTVAATRAYKIETVDEGSNDSKPQTTQIVIQTSAPSVSQQTAVIPQPVIQQQHHIQTQQQLQSQNHHQINTVGITSGVSNTAISTHVVGSHKRPAQRSSVGSVTHVKRSKTNTIDPLECVETGNGTSTSQQMTIQTAIVSGAKSQQNESDYIDLPLELPTKSEPDYVDETGEVDQNEQDATYVEDEPYGDLRYDDTYFTENEDVVSGTATTTTTAANINVSNTTNANVTGVSGTTASGVVGTATTSKAIAKQQSTSFSDSSYADATDQTNNDAQVFVMRLAARKPQREHVLSHESKLNFALRKKQPRHYKLTPRRDVPEMLTNSGQNTMSASSKAIAQIKIIETFEGVNKKATVHKELNSADKIIKSANNHHLSVISRPRLFGLCVYCLQKPFIDRSLLSRINTYCPQCPSGCWTCESCFDARHPLND